MESTSEHCRKIADALRGVDKKLAGYYDGKARLAEFDDAGGYPRAGHGGLTNRRNAVRVGVKGWSGAGSSAEAGEWGASLQVVWVEVDGVRIPGDIIEVDLLPLRDDFHTMRVLQVVGAFEFVDINTEGE